MTQSRDFGPEAARMREALSRHSKEELVDLMTHLLRVYVIEENAPLTPDVDRPRAPEDLARLSFPQLLLHLQMSLQHEELGRFRVSGEEVFVSWGEQEYLLGGPGPQIAAPAEAVPVPVPVPASAPAPVVVAPSPPAFDFDEIAPPSAPVTKEKDFDLDDDDILPAQRPPAKGTKPAPEPLGPRAAAATPDRADSLFGGSTGRLMSGPPLPPPPIAERAPGDPTPEEQAAARRTPRAEPASKAAESRPGKEPPPPLADGDKDIKSSNRFADLELD